MNSLSRTTAVVITALAVLSLIVPSSAQQQAAPAAQAAPPVQQAPAVSQPQAPAQAAPVQEATPAQSPLPATPTSQVAIDSKAGKFGHGMDEMTPLSMYLKADIVVKAVMIGLAFASLVTWTIFIAKMIEMTLIQRKLRNALKRIGDARSLAEAQFALGAKGSILSPLLAAAMREARLSACLLYTSPSPRD